MRIKDVSFINQKAPENRGFLASIKLLILFLLRLPDPGPAFGKPL